MPRPYRIGDPEAGVHRPRGPLSVYRPLPRLRPGAQELSTMDLRVRPETAPADLVATPGSFATVLARVVDGAPPGARGWHPFGLADAAGFAGMACDELLVHTGDAARGLEVPFTPPPS